MALKKAISEFYILNVFQHAHPAAFQLVILGNGIFMSQNYSLKTDRTYMPEKNNYCLTTQVTDTDTHSYSVVQESVS